MSRRSRIAAFASVAGLLMLSTGIYVGIGINRASVRANAPSKVATTTMATVEAQPHIVFRNTEVGRKYGLVAMVGLNDPSGPRAFTHAACDRVYAVAGEASCLRIQRGIATSFEASLLDDHWDAVRKWPLPGIPSRTRLSADGRFVATTTFVSGHSYMQTGFSTATEIRRVDGRSYGNLEAFELLVQGARDTASDRNIWGVTFDGDGNTFYATAATAGKTYLVRGDISARTMTAIHTTAECPSLAPDGARIAYKKNAGGSTPHWTIAVLDLVTGDETLLRGESRSVDDQVEWLDGDTLLYGLARTDEAGVSDVWEIKINPTAKPVRLIAEAWSPSVVRS